MLSSQEIALIKETATEVFVVEADKAHTREAYGIPTNSSKALEAMLYDFAMGLYTYGSSLNYLSDCQVQAIYSRLREMSDVR